VLVHADDIDLARPLPAQIQYSHTPIKANQFIEDTNSVNSINGDTHSQSEGQGDDNVYMLPSLGLVDTVSGIVALTRDMSNRMISTRQRNTRAAGYLQLISCLYRIPVYVYA
jgi:hypothetical protein